MAFRLRANEGGMWLVEGIVILLVLLYYDKDCCAVTIHMRLTWVTIIIVDVIDSSKHF